MNECHDVASSLTVQASLNTLPADNHSLKKGLELLLIKGRPHFCSRPNGGLEAPHSLLLRMRCSVPNCGGDRRTHSKACACAVPFPIVVVVTDAHLARHALFCSELCGADRRILSKACACAVLPSAIHGGGDRRKAYKIHVQDVLHAVFF